MVPKNILRLRTRLILGYAVIIVIMLVQAVLIYKSVLAKKERVLQTKHTVNTISSGHRLESLLADMETSERSYLIGGKSSFLIPFINGKNSFENKLAETIKLVSDNKDQVELLNNVRLLEISWLEESAKPEIAMRQKMNQGLIELEEISLFVFKQADSNIMTALRSQMSEFINIELARLTKL